MVDTAKPGKKRGRKKGEAKKVKSNASLVEMLQKEYDQLIESKKVIDRKIKVHEKYCLEMGYKLTKRAGKSNDESSPVESQKTGKRRGRKPKQPIVKSEEATPKTEGTELSS